MKIGLILQLLDRLLDAVERVLRERRQRKEQRERDALEKNPAGWFDSHFGGVPPRDDADAPTQTDARDRTPK